MLPETRYSLIARLARPEDTATWHEFLQTYESAILRFCRARGLQDADAAEVAQDVLMAVHSVAPSWEPSGQTGSFRAWLFETARRSCLNAIRKRASARQSQLDDENLPVGSIDVLSELTEAESVEWRQWAFYAAASAVQREVEESTWQAFWLTTVESLPTAEVANRLQLSLGNVYTAKSRVMGRLRKRVAELSMSDREPDDLSLTNLTRFGKQHHATDM